VTIKRHCPRSWFGQAEQKAIKTRRRKNPESRIGSVSPRLNSKKRKAKKFAKKI
jgi:hypothetical protein